MCRLLGFAAPAPRPPTAAVGEFQLATFCAMARLHDDGWGAAWTAGPGAEGDADGGVRVRRSHRSGYQDRDLDRLTTQTPARAGLLHLRLASSGMPVVPENTHPFLDAGVALAHNGAVKPVARLEELLPADVLQRLRGSTDSERYAALVRLRAADVGDLAAGAALAAAQLSPLFPSASLNAVVLSARELVVVHASDGARIPHEDFDASGLAEHELPVDHRTGYYQLWRRRSADGTVVFSSSGLRTHGWEPLPPRVVVRVDLATLEETVLPLDRAARALPALPRIPAQGSSSSRPVAHESHERAGGARVGA